MAICHACTSWLETFVQHHFPSRALTETSVGSKAPIDGTERADDRASTLSYPRHIETSRFRFRVNIHDLYASRTTCWFCSRFWLFIRLVGNRPDAPLTDEDVLARLKKESDDGDTIECGTEYSHCSTSIGFIRIFTYGAISSVEFEIEKADRDTLDAVHGLDNVPHFSAQGRLIRHDTIECEPNSCRSSAESTTDAGKERTHDEIRLEPEIAEDSQIMAYRLGTLSYWLEECDRDHANCSSSVFEPNGSSFLPRRLISINRNEGITHINLVESVQLCDPGAIRYATLSHCWGREPFQTLTRENYSVYLQAIDISSLSKTFRQAIWLCHALGLGYIWIDSLCIIQNSDNNADWKAQAPMMHLVYMHSYVNFSASASRLGRQGLLRPLNQPAFAPLVIALPEHGLILPENSAGTEHMQLFIAIDHGNSPVFGRGWCLQEFFLARRTIHMNDVQTYWQCRSGMNSEYRLPMDGMDGGDRMGWSGLWHSKSAGSIWDRSTGAEAARTVEGVWITLAESYSKTKVTFASDKEFALLGLAAVFRQRFAQLGVRTDWIYGCWSHDLVRCLLWSWQRRGSMPDEQSSTGDGTDNAAVEAKEPLFPTWSWLSSPDAVKFAVHGAGPEYLSLVKDEASNDDPRSSENSIRHALNTMSLDAEDDKLTPLQPSRSSSKKLLLQAPFFECEQEEYSGVARMIHIPPTDTPLDTSLWRLKCAHHDEQHKVVDPVLSNRHIGDGPLSTFQVELDKHARLTPRKNYTCVLARREGAYVEEDETKVVACYQGLVLTAADERKDGKSGESEMKEDSADGHSIRDGQSPVSLPSATSAPRLTQPPTFERYGVWFLRVLEVNAGSTMYSKIYTQENMSQLQEQAAELNETIHQFFEEGISRSPKKFCLI